MEAILEKIESYHIFTSLYPGILFAVLSEGMFHEWVMQLQETSMVMALCVCYFIGMLINRVGSLVVEPCLKKTGLVTFAPLEQYIEASKKDSKIEILSESNNTYRSLAALFLILGLHKLILVFGGECLEKFCIEHMDWILILVWFLGLLMMVVSYRKQTQYIVKRIKKILNN